MGSIYDFNKGDEVVRVEPSKVIGSGGFHPKGQRDRSYIGDKLIFVGIANGCAYLKRTGIKAKIFGDDLLDLPLDIYDEGWDYYIDPQTLVDDIIPLHSLERALMLALEKEDYEAAANIQKRINLKNKS